MALASTDLIFYASASVPLDDTSTSGGVIDPLRRLPFDDLTANDTIQALSSSGADTAITVTVDARLPTGVEVSETKTLTGTTAITFSTLGTVQRILAVELSAACAGTITIRRTTGAVLIQTIPIGERGIKRHFRRTITPTSGITYRYEKAFWKNTNGTFSAVSCIISQSSDPSSRIDTALALAVSDSVSVANRLTAPGGLTFNDLAKNVPGGVLNPGQAIGIWFRQTANFNDPALDSTYGSVVNCESS